MDSSASPWTVLIVGLFILCGIVRLVEAELRDPALAELFRRYFSMRPLKKLIIGLFVIENCLIGGSKPTNDQSQAESGGATNTVVIAQPGEDEQVTVVTPGTGGTMAGMTQNEPMRLTSNQYAAGFALLPRAHTNTAWLAVPSNAIVNAPWTRYGLAEDTFWLPATNWGFVLGTNAVEGAHVSSSGTLSFDPATPKGSPRATAMPDGDSLSFLAPLQGSLGTVPLLGRFWHAATTNSSMLMTWQDLYAGRDTNSPVTFQAELFPSGDFIYRYAFTNALSLTNFVIGAQHNLGGETYALDATNMLVNGLELRWRWFGILDPNIDDHDGDGVSTYDEVMLHDSDPTMPDTDLDGLGDAQENPESGPYPRVRDSDGDGLVDGADPHPMSADSLADNDGDGLPDAWEVYAFGGTNVTDSAAADANGDGFSDRVSMLAGICPTNAPAPGFAVAGTMPAGLDAWEIAPAFALDMQAGLTNILTRTIPAGRTSPWQQYFVSSDPRSAGAWSLDGLELSWSGTNVSGNATASPAGDSMRLGLGTNMPAALTFRLAPTRSQGLLRCTKPLYLVRWSPQPVFTPGETVATAVSSNGVRYTAALLPSAFAPALPFTLNPGSRPHKAAPDPDELAELSMPPDPSSYAYADFAAGLASGTLTAPAPTAASLPACGTNTAARVLLYRFEIIRNARIVLDRPLGQYAAPFPLDTASLRDKWRANAAATESLGIDGFSVYTGISDPAFTVRINGEVRDWYAWDEGGSSRAASSLMTPAALLQQSPCGGGAAVDADLCTSNLVDQCVDRDPEDDDSDSGGGTSESSGGDPEEDETCDSCESGSCGEGPQLNSLKFRIPLGSRGRGRVSGFLWFAIDAPRAVDRGLFSVLADDSVYTETNEAAMTVSCFAERGRTLAVSNVTCGVRIWVSEASGALEHSWEITNPGNDTGVMCIVQRDQAGNRKTDKTYTYNDGQRLWLCTDGLDGHAETLQLSGAVGPGSTLQEVRVKTVAGDTVSSEITQKTAFGEGESAVGRVTCRDTLVRDGIAGSTTYIRREYAYWTDNLHPRRNGLLKYARGGGEAWAYHAYDERGRTVLSAEQLDGSAFPEALASSGDVDTVAELAAIPGLTCRARTYSYDPVAGTDDTASHNDSRKPRTLAAYVVRDGSAVAVSREWRVLTRGQTEAGLPTLNIRTVRAASAQAAYGDAANAVTASLAYAGSEDPVLSEINMSCLWDLPLSETSEDGTLRTWAYELGNFNFATGAFTADNNGACLRVTARTGTAALPHGVEDLSTYEVEIRDAAFGQTLRRETRLHSGGDPLLSWDESAYDVKGRLLGSRHSDGTGATNVWDCCRLTAVIGRDGRRTDTVVIPEQPNFSASVESSSASLPGANGLCPSVETYTDPLGRVTNSVRLAYTYPGLTGSSAYPAQNTTIRHPYGVEGYSETTDPLGVVTARKKGYGANWVAEETAAAGVTERVTKNLGGATATLRQWTDPVSGTALSQEKRTESSWDSAGLETVTVSGRSGGGTWIAESATSKDFLGRTVAVATSGFGGAALVESNAYDNAGRMILSVGRDGSRTAYAYTALGEPAGMVRIGAGQTLQFDPQSFTLAGVIALDTYVVTETPAWKESGDLSLSAWGVPQAWWECGAVISHTPGQGPATTSVSRVQLTGLSAACVRRTVTTDVNGVTTITTEAVNSGTAKTTVTSVSTATSATAITETVAGAQTFSTNTMGGAASYLFDGLARQVTAVETTGGRTLERTTGYHGDGTVAFTAETGGGVSNVTTYSERQYLQTPAGAYTVTATDALGNETVSCYSGDGALYSSAGAVYPTATARDAGGRQSELKTWRDETGQPDITRWHYDETTGLLTNKVYADGKGPAYTYTADGRPTTRTWARGVTTTYAYTDNANGSVQTVGYSDATPDTTNRYDLTGRLVAVADGAGSRTLSYDAKGRLTAETNSLAVLIRRYDSMGRDAGFDLDLPGFATNTFGVRYAYDGSGRIDTVTSGVGGESNTYAYSFLPGTALVTGMTNSLGGSWTRSYESCRNLIVAVSNFWNATSVSSFSYENDALGRRTLRIDTAAALSATNAFAYNHRSEVTNAEMHAATYSYAYDCIGNRRLALSNAVACTYSASQLNQYSSVTNAGANVPVAYDLDGNMTRYGANSYEWDGENRMTKAEPWGVATNGSRIVENGYDHQNRRVRKAVRQLEGRGPGYPLDPSQPGTWNVVETRHFIWDGWNIAAEIVIDHSACATNVHYYTWGLDLSGSIQGAGGVGGLLADTIVGPNSPQPVTYCPAFDANGNVSEYVDGTGTVRGHYEYSAFGEITAQSGDLASIFTHRFSTKPFDAETGVSKFQQRDYIPPLGRWASRDPQAETDCINLYAFVHNATISVFDVLGLDSWKWRANDLGCRDAIVVTNGSTINITGGGERPVRWSVTPKKSRKHLFSSCCTVHVEADAVVEFWWSIAPPGGNLHLTPLQHEQSHVMQFLQEWRALESDVMVVLPKEIKCSKASCYYEVIEYLRLARYNLAYAKGYDFDIRDGQRKQAERDDRQRKADDYFLKAVQKKRECQAK